MFKNVSNVSNFTLLREVNPATMSSVSGKFRDHSSRKTRLKGRQKGRNVVAIEYMIFRQDFKKNKK